jgi:hypothetical protein
MPEVALARVALDQAEATRRQKAGEYSPDKLPHA